MTPEEQTELLVRIEERMKGICVKLDLMINDRIMLITHDEKIKTHSKLIWSVVLGLVGLSLKVLFSGAKVTP